MGCESEGVVLLCDGTRFSTGMEESWNCSVGVDGIGCGFCEFNDARVWEGKNPNLLAQFVIKA